MRLQRKQAYSLVSTKLHYRAIRLLTYEGSEWRDLGCARVQNALRWPLSWKGINNKWTLQRSSASSQHCSRVRSICCIMDCGYEEWSHHAYNAVLFTTDCGTSMDSLRVALHLQMLFCFTLVWGARERLALLRDFSAMANRRMCEPPPLQDISCQSISSSYFVMVSGKKIVALGYNIIKNASVTQC
jgi:hypothetical protein